MSSGNLNTPEIQINNANLYLLESIKRKGEAANRKYYSCLQTVKSAADDAKCQSIHGKSYEGYITALKKYLETNDKLEVLNILQIEWISVKKDGVP